MKYTLEIEIDKSKIKFAEEFFRNISFVKKVKPFFPNEIKNKAILKSIEDYEKGETKPTPLNLKELMQLINE